LIVTSGSWNEPAGVADTATPSIATMRTALAGLSVERLTGEPFVRYAVPVLKLKFGEIWKPSSRTLPGLP
jgi:hypothetical protein